MGNLDEVCDKFAPTRLPEPHLSPCEHVLGRTSTSMSENLSLISGFNSDQDFLQESLQEFFYSSPHSDWSFVIKSLNLLEH